MLLQKCAEVRRVRCAGGDDVLDAGRAAPGAGVGPMVPARGGPGAHLRSQGAQIIFSSTWSTSSSMHIWCASNEAMVSKDKKQLFREYSFFTRCTAAAPPLLVTCAACAGTLPETGPSSASTSSMSTSTSAPTKSTSKVTAASRFLSCHVGTWLLTWCTLWLKVQGKFGHLLSPAA